MRIHEAAEAVGCTRRAIKFYEEKGLLPAVGREENGYRDYTDADIRTLHEIQAYRKLGIGLSDIRRLLRGEARDLLPAILAQKRTELNARKEEVAALEAYIAGHDPEALDEAVDFSSIAKAIQAQLPGFFGAYFLRHFAPFLNIRITTPEQQAAYKRILAFWDETDIRIPPLLRLVSLLTPPQFADQLDARLQAQLHPDEEAYARLKKQVAQNVKLRRNPLVRYHPLQIEQRRLMRRLQDCGYNDRFIPDLKLLSPAYCEYHDALTALNKRLTQDLGLHYDSHFNLIMP